MIKERKIERKFRRKLRIRKKVLGTSLKPRLTFFKGSSSLYVQLIDDEKSHTILGLVSLEGKNKSVAKKLGLDFLVKMKPLKIEEVVFDRNGFKYHGVIKEFADTLREGGLKF